MQTSSTIIFVAIIAIYFEWSLGLLAISFTPIILFSTYLQRSLLFREDFISSGAIKTSTKVNYRVHFYKQKIIILIDNLFINFITYFIL